MKPGAPNEEPVVVFRLPWRASSSAAQLVIIAGFVFLLAVAVFAPWTDKLSFPLYRAAMALVGAALGYFVLCTLVNETIVSVYRGTLHVRHIPLSQFGFGPSQVDVPVADVVAIEQAVLFAIRARLRDGKDVLIVDPPSAARERLASELAERLGVPVRPR